MEEYDLERSDFANEYDDEEDNYEEDEEYEYEEHRPVTPILPERPASTLLKVQYSTTVLCIRDILIGIRIRGYLPLTYESGQLFLRGFQDDNKI